MNMRTPPEVMLRLSGRPLLNFLYFVHMFSDDNKKLKKKKLQLNIILINA